MSHIDLLRQALDFIQANLRDEIDVDAVAAHVHMSPSRFHTVFESAMGQTTGDYIRKRRLAWAALDLALSSKRLIDIALEYRFGSQESFTRSFRRVYGIAPGAFRNSDYHVQTMARLGVHRSKRLVGEGVSKMTNPSDRAASASDGNGSERLVLEGVPRVGFYNGGDQCPEDVPFPSCLAACLRYLGEDYPWLPLFAHNKTWHLNYANVFILAVTGMTFGLLWRDGWHLDNADLMMISDPREVIDIAFRATGYSYEIIHKAGHPDDEQLFRTQIRQSLAQGRPVLGFGVIGPPECCVITGYDDDGDVLIGWNYFQDTPDFHAGAKTEPCGYFRKAGWFRETMALIVIGQKTGQTPGIGTAETLLRALQIGRTPSAYGRHSGLAAYDAWRKQILDDAAFSGQTADVLRLRHEVHNSAVGIVAECRSWAGVFLSKLAEDHPAAATPLEAAADCYHKQHDLMWKVWGLVGGNGNPEAFVRFADAAVRRQIAAVIEEARRLDEQALDHIEKALAVLKAWR